MHDFEYENNGSVKESIVKIIKNYHPRAHFIVISSSSSVFTL